MLPGSGKQTQRQLETEIRNRINEESPTKYDVDFYKRKISRYENDLNILQDQLNKARVRLRRAEDFELKYDMVVKQTSNLQSDLDHKEKLLNQKKAESQQLKLQVQQKHSKGEDWTKQKLDLHKQVDKWKVKAEESEERRISYMMQSKEKAQLNQKRDFQILKKQSLEKQEMYQFQIRQLKKTIHEKQNVQNVINNRVQKIRNQKDEQINRLQQNIDKQRVANSDALKQKNQQFEKYKEKFQKIFNFQLENLKKNNEDQEDFFNIQMSGFKQMLVIKNDEISKLLEDLKKETKEHQIENQYQKYQTNILKEKIYTIERQGEIELYNLKERITRVHAADIEEIEKRYNDIINGLKDDRKQAEKLLKEKDSIVEAEKKEYQRMKEQMNDKLRERDTRISHLMQRIKESSQQTDNQLKNLHQSFHQIQSEKQIMSSEYQTNVGFLNQQLSMINAKNETLAATIKSLHEQISRIKKQYSETMQQLQLKWRAQRKEYEEQKQHERQKFEKLQQENRQKDRQWKIKEKQLQRLRQKQEREKNKLQFIVEEMERDTERLNAYIKQQDQSLKRELKKNQMSTLDSGGVRRELNSQLQRQKSELEAIKRMEVDQFKNKIEIQVTKITNENQKLQTDLLNKSLALDKIENQYKKLQQKTKNIDKINKDKLIQYEKKMSTLNSEINLTQTMYQNFLNVKAKERKQQNY